MTTEQLLEDWRAGKGTPYQQRMGELAAFYKPGPYVPMNPVQSTTEQQGHTMAEVVS